MGKGAMKLAEVDPLWSRIRTEAEEVTETEPLMASLVHQGVLYHKSLDSVLSFRLAQKLASPEMSELILREILYRHQTGQINKHDVTNSDKPV